MLVTGAATAIVTTLAASASISCRTIGTVRNTCHVIRNATDIAATSVTATVMVIATAIAKNGATTATRSVVNGVTKNGDADVATDMVTATIVTD